MPGRGPRAAREAEPAARWSAGGAGRRRSEEEKPKTLAREPIDGRERTPRPDAGGDPRDAVPRADAGAHERAKRIRRGGAGRVDAAGVRRRGSGQRPRVRAARGLFPRAPNLPGCAEGTEPRAPRCGRERATERAGRDAHHDGALLLVLGDSRAGNRGGGRRARGAFRRSPASRVRDRRGIKVGPHSRLTRKWRCLLRPDDPARVVSEQSAPPKRGPVVPRVVKLPPGAMAGAAASAPEAGSGSPRWVPIDALLATAAGDLRSGELVHVAGFSPVSYTHLTLPTNREV